MACKTRKSQPRLYVSSPLGDDMDVVLGKDQTHYLRAVMRLRPGDQVRVFNGRDGEWHALIKSLSKKSAALTCTSQLRQQEPAGDLWYLFAPLKQARLDFMAQKATEMGATLIKPVKTAYTQVSRINEARIRANAVEAAEQCHLLYVPEIGTYTPLEEILAAWPKDRGLIFCNETLKSGSPLDDLKALETNSLAVLVGPEGGFSPDEVKLLESHDFVIPISLGPRVLRADTAGVAALAIIQAIKGDG